MRCYLLLDSSKRGIVGGGSIYTKLQDDFLLRGSCTLLGTGALVAPGFILVVTAVASFTSVGAGLDLANRAPRIMPSANTLDDY